MAQIDHATLKRWLEDHESAIATLFEQAQREAGGHYAKMTATARRRQAEIDGRELIADLLQGGVDRVVVRETVQAAEARAVASDDIVRLATAMDRLFTSYIEAQLAGQPEMAQELVRRSRNLIASFRASVTAARLDGLLERFKKPSAP
ncbi:MAG TPA: hypothetical protein VM536_20780 [Chloroflexia bacterium]|nr:hypothetical protein [Chloroflexia bacterium]